MNACLKDTFIYF